MPGEHVDLASDAHERASTAPGARRFVGIYFACCGVYSRVYVNAEGTAYVGYCPRCCGRVELEVGPHGTTQRFFAAF